MNQTKYDEGKRFNLSHVFLDMNGDVVRIGDFFRNKCGTSSKKFNVDFLKAFCTTNGIRYNSTTKDAYMMAIAAAKQEEKATQNSLLTNVVIDDDTRETEQDTTTGRSSDASYLSDLTDKLGGLKLGGKNDRERVSFLDEVRVDLEK